MIVQFSIHPVGGTPHTAADLQRALGRLRELGLEYEIGPGGTCVRGDWERVLEAVRVCHETVAEGRERVVTTITIDDSRIGEHSLRGAVAAVAADHETNEETTGRVANAHHHAAHPTSRVGYDDEPDPGNRRDLPRRPDGGLACLDRGELYSPVKGGSVDGDEDRAGHFPADSDDWDLQDQRR